MKEAATDNLPVPKPHNTLTTKVVVINDRVTTVPAMAVVTSHAIVNHATIQRQPTPTQSQQKAPILRMLQNLKSKDKGRKNNNSQDKADTSQGRADTSQGKADTSQGRADTSQDRADTSQDRADTSQGRADTSQGRADTSQGRADTSQDRADTSQDRADTSQDRADTSPNIPSKNIHRVHVHRCVSFHGHNLLSMKCPSLTPTPRFA